jgi:type II secretory pathway predicted ATPase ExeA
MRGFMYHTHFGLQKRLFDEGVAADAAVFRNGQHAGLVEQLKLAFASSTSVVVLRGPAGVGKSTLISAALRASSTRLALAWLNGTPTNAAELLELLLVELGVNTARTSRVERLQLWRQFQAEMAATVSRLFVVVERTEDLPVEVLHALDSATAADAAGHPGANVVLLGHHRLDEHLADPVLDSFRQRIRLRAELKPFTQAELQDYLRHRVAVAEGNYDRVFALGAVAALHRYSRGIARLTNNLCETALTLAASRGQKLLTADLVNEAAVTWLGLSEPQAVAVPPVASTTPVPPPITVTVSAPIAFTPAAPTVVVSRNAPVASVAPPRPPAAAAAPTVVSAPRAPAAPAVVSTPPATPAAPIANSALPRPPPRVTPPPAVAEEFDGGETDIPDVSIVDFPVLTDAIDGAEPSGPEPTLIVASLKPSPKAPAAPAVATPPPAPPPRSATPPPPAAPRPPPAPAASTAAPVPPRVATAHSGERTAPPSKPTPPATPPPKPAAATAPPKPAAAIPAKPATPSLAPKAPAPRPAEPPSEDDAVYQTQTARAISEAKSIVDISESMAETLFGDAELDFLSTSLAAETGAAPTPAPAPAAAAPAKPKPAKAARSDDDDLLDLLGLSDAPLELIDDSAQPPSDKAQKSGTKR